MELKHLHSAIVLAEELNFTKAARRLNMTQPPLSRQIKQLEEDLDTILFHRDRNHVVLTEAGKLFVEEARKIVGQFTNLKEKIHHLQHENKCIIGFMGYASIVFIPEMVNYLHSFGVETKLKEFSDNQQLIEALSNDEIDYAFHYPSQYIPDDISSKEIFSEPIAIIVNKDHPLANKEQWEMEDLIAQKFIMPPKETAPILMQRFHYMTNRIGFTPNIVQELNAHRGRLELVSKGLGITFDGTSLQKMNIPNLVFKTTPDGGETFAKIFMSYKQEQNSSLDAITNFFKEFFKTYRKY